MGGEVLLTTIGEPGRNGIEKEMDRIHRGNTRGDEPIGELPRPLLILTLGKEFLERSPLKGEGDEGEGELEMIVVEEQGG